MNDKHNLTSKMNLTLTINIYLTCILIGIISFFFSPPSSIAKSRDVRENEVTSKLYCQANGYVFSTENSINNESKENALLIAEQFVQEKISNYLRLLLKKKLSAVQSKNFDQKIQTITSKQINTKSSGDNFLGIRIIVEFEDNDLFNDNSLLGIELNTDKIEYQEDEKIQLQLFSKNDHYFCLIDKNPEGNLVQLIPNTFTKNKRYKAEKKYLFPDYSADQTYNFIAQKPFGQENLYLFAADIPIGEMFSNKKYIDFSYKTDLPLETFREQFIQNIINHLSNLSDDNTFECVRFEEKNIHYSVLEKVLTDK